MKPVKVGLVGCGYISGIYLENSRRLHSFDVVACADLVRERAEARAEVYGVPRVLTPDEIYGDPDIEMILNLTTPDAHYTVARRAIEAGKSIYSEKPLAVELEDGKRLVDAAEEAGVLIGGAPDTFMGGGIQTCRKLIGDGAIGEPVASTAFLMCHGHESWHPDPEFYYKRGGGPMFDMGPYYLTALVNLVGPIKQVTGAARVTFPKRVITSQPKHGTEIEVDVPTHVAGVTEHTNGAIGTIITSFDVWGANLPRIEVYGTEGSLSVPDPNTFGGPVKLLRMGEKQWVDIPLSHGYTENSRGIGVADMANALRSGRPHRASGELTYHVLEAMHAFHSAAEERRTVTLRSLCGKPTPLPVGLREGSLDP
ncbi:Gfo/Idh/MocA family oxidoreductase [Candidatus Bathyarchaeota archaeon]|nr:Gfo/Idh/MocA family oxidoreductase [Candidatus Bathyarchaeota archaeon]